jgi:transcriptional regulator with XRE-family HTH domain
MVTDKKTQKLILRKLLKTVREQADIRQIDLALRLKRPQSFVSKYESGEKSLNVIEIREVCVALGVSLPEFIRQFEEEINAG